MLGGGYKGTGGRVGVGCGYNAGDIIRFYVCISPLMLRLYKMHSTQGYGRGQ